MLTLNKEIMIIICSKDCYWFLFAVNKLNLRFLLMEYVLSLDSYVDLILGLLL